MTDPWLCPNEPPCPHAAFVHDVYDRDDPSPQCCMVDCSCGHPGTATVRLMPDGTRFVLDADPVILVHQELLDTAAPDAWDGEILQLDTAGMYRYRCQRPGKQHNTFVFIRI